MGFFFPNVYGYGALLGVQAAEAPLKLLRLSSSIPNIIIYDHIIIELQSYLDVDQSKDLAASQL